MKKFKFKKIIGYFILMSLFALILFPAYYKGGMGLVAQVVSIVAIILGSIWLAVYLITDEE